MITVSQIPAVRILSGEDGKSYFLRGFIKTDTILYPSEMHFATEISQWQLSSHNAPTRQLVITLSGKLKFTTGDNKSFVIEPGTVLLAEDTSGAGHSWELIDGHQSWNRIYIPLREDAETFFVQE